MFTPCAEKILPSYAVTLSPAHAICNFFYPEPDRILLKGNNEACLLNQVDIWPESAGRRIM